MSEPESGQWMQMASAPKDGTRVLVAVRGSEQGPAEVDVAQWAKPDPSGEECWIAADSDPGCVVLYADAELVGWMPLPTPLPALRSVRAALDRPRRGGDAGRAEMAGSGI